MSCKNSFLSKFFFIASSTTLLLLLALDKLSQHWLLFASKNPYLTKNVCADKNVNVGGL